MKPPKSFFKAEAYWMAIIPWAPALVGLLLTLIVVLVRWLSQ